MSDWKVVGSMRAGLCEACQEARVLFKREDGRWICVICQPKPRADSPEPQEQ